MTRYAWVFNLDADFELTRPGYSTTDLLRDQLARHREAAAAMLMGANDVIASPGACRGFVGRAWCPTPRAVAVLKASGAEPEPHPARNILRLANHRRFAHQLGGGLPGQAYVESRSALADVLRDDSRAWLLKRPLAFAGRGQSRVTGAITAKQEAWIAASLRDDGLIAEPLVTPTFEVSLHGRINAAHVELGEVCTQEVTATRRVSPGRVLTQDDKLSGGGERAALFRQRGTRRSCLDRRRLFWPLRHRRLSLRLPFRPRFLRAQRNQRALYARLCRRVRSIENLEDSVVRLACQPPNPFASPHR